MKSYGTTSSSVLNLSQFITVGLIDLGIVRIGDLFDTRGEFKSNKEPLYSTLSPVEHFLLFSSLNAFPEEWPKILKTNKISISSKTHNLIQTDFNLRIEGKKVNFQNLKGTVSRVAHARLSASRSTSRSNFPPLQVWIPTSVT